VTWKKSQILDEFWARTQRKIEFVQDSTSNHISSVTNDTIFSTKGLKRFLLVDSDEYVE
jgi:hypothetical protein